MRKRLAGAIFILFLALGAGAAGAFAQTADPSPTPIVVNPGQIADTFTQLSKSAVKFLEFMRDEIEAPLNDYFFLLATALLSLLSCAAFLRLKDANDGQLTVLMVLRFIMRFAVCAFLMTVVLQGTDTLRTVGYRIAYGTPDNTGTTEFRDSWLGKLVNEQEESFEASYERYTDCLFTVKVNGQPTDLTDPGDGTVTVLGVTQDQGLSLVTNTANSLTTAKWDPNAAFSRLSWGRFAVAAADLFNTYLPRLVLIFLRLFAPFAVAVAVDKGLAARITWQWIWGMVAIGVLLPVLSQLLKFAAYLAGNLALQVGDPAPIWSWDYATMTILKTGPGDPAQLVNLGFVTMLIMAALLASAIVVAYQITMGRVYETGSQLISSYIFGGTSVGAGVVSAETAAAINRQAENAQIFGQSRAETEQLKGQRESADIRDGGNAVAQRAQSKAQAYQGAAVAESSSVASIERARASDARTVRESDAAHERTLTESEGRTQATDVEAQDKANQQRSGLSGTIVDAGKGVIRGGGHVTDGPAGDAPVIEGGLSGRDLSEVVERRQQQQAGDQAGGHADGQGDGQAQKEEETERGIGGPIGPTSKGGQYGAPRDYGHHTGFDFNSMQGFTEGTRVGAAAKGTVIFAGRDGGYGNRVVIDHGNGVVTTYSHLEDGSIANLAVGQRVQRGAIIGRVGNTGDSHGAHLHFEVGALGEGADKYGAPVIAKVNPASTSYRPFALGKGVDPYAAMPTQAGQAAREASRLRELGVTNASADYRDAIVASSGMARDDEIGIASRQAQRDVGINWTAHSMRVTAINAQERTNLHANQVMYEHGIRAMEERRDSSLRATALREQAAIISAAGSVVSQQISRLNETFRF